MTQPQDPIRRFYCKKYAMSKRKASHLFCGTALIHQLDACADEAAQRLLLGVSRKQQTGKSKQRTVHSDRRAA